VTSVSPIQGAKVEIPGDPYPNRPQDFTTETAVPVNDPSDSNDCMWSDTVINIGYRDTPPPMGSAKAAGPAVHFGPYRTFFNRDVTVTVPYDSASGGTEKLMVYIYNHLSEDWDPIEPESVDKANKLVTFKTQVLGLFQVAGGGLCPTEQIYVRSFRDNVLSKTPEGQEIIRLYYELAPGVVKAMGEDEGFKIRMKAVIDGILPLVRAGGVK